MASKVNPPADSRVSLKPVQAQYLKIKIQGTSPMIQHQWSEKALRAMRDKHAGKKTKEREIRDPQQEGVDAMYKTDDGRPGIPLLAIKSALIDAAHKDLGIEKTLVRKALFVQGGGAKMVIPMECKNPIIREDYVRVGQGSTDLRYRPQFDEWSAELLIQYDADLLQPADIVNLINRAGFGIGIGEWRPEKNGEYGRFQVVSE